MEDESTQRRGKGRDGASGLVDHDRALRARNTRRPTRAEREAARQRIALERAPRRGDED